MFYYRQETDKGNTQAPAAFSSTAVAPVSVVVVGKPSASSHIVFMFDFLLQGAIAKWLRRQIRISHLELICSSLRAQVQILLASLCFDVF